MNRGDVVIVDFPFSDGSGSKTRPALIVQADSLNRALSDTIAASISTSAQGDATHVLISPASDPQSRLQEACGPRCEKLHMINRSEIYGSLGKLSPQSMKKVDACLKIALGIK